MKTSAQQRKPVRESSVLESQPSEYIEDKYRKPLSLQSTLLPLLLISLFVFLHFKPLASLRSFEFGSSAVVSDYRVIRNTLVNDDEMLWMGRRVYRPNRIACAMVRPSSGQAERAWERFGELCEVFLWIHDKESLKRLEGEHLNGISLMIDDEGSAFHGKVWQYLFSKYLHRAEWFLKLDNLDKVDIVQIEHASKFKNPSVAHHFVLGKSNDESQGTHLLSYQALWGLGTVLNQFSISSKDTTVSHALLLAGIVEEDLFS